MTVSMGTLVQSWSRPTLLTALGLLSLLHVTVFFLALALSPTLFHSAAQEGAVCRQDHGDADPTGYGDDVSLGNCAPANAGGWGQLSGSVDF